MSGSLSQTPTISQPAIRRICDACASAIFPQPTMATLSMEAALPAALEVPMEPFGCRDLRRPSELGLELAVAIARLFPVGVPAAAGERRRPLLVRPARGRFPQRATP